MKRTGEHHTDRKSSDNAEPNGRDRLRTWGSFATVILLGVVAALMFSRRASNGPKLDQGSSIGARASNENAATGSTRTAGPPREPDATRPVIARVTVEKSEVCAGEENLIEVVAHDADGRDEHLRISVDDPGSGRKVWGAKIPYRLERPLGRPMRVVVEGRRGVAGADVPHVTVKDCVALHQVTIDVQRTQDAMDRVKLKAQITEPPSSADAPTKRLVPLVYRWDFGDGSKETTSGPEVEHSYEAREQNVATASFIAAVRIEGRDGEEAKGSRAIAFPNLGFSRLTLEGSVLISAGFQESPASDTAASRTERVWLYHGYRQPVRIDKVKLRETVLENHEERETLSRDFDPEALLGFRELPPRQSLTTRDLTAFYPSTKDATAVRYVEVRGRTTDGKEASGTFTLLASSTRDARRSPRPQERL